MNEIERNMIDYKPELSYQTIIKNNVIRRNTVDINLPVDSPRKLGREETTTYYTPAIVDWDFYSEDKVIQDYRQLKEKAKVIQDIVRDYVDDKKSEGGDIEVPEIVSSDLIPKNPEEVVQTPRKDLVFIGDKLQEQIKHIERQIEELYDIELDNEIIERFLERVNGDREEAKRREAERFTFISDMQYSSREKEHIENLILAGLPGVKSVADYTNRLIQDYVREGVDGLDYSQITNNVRLNYMLSTEIGQVSIMLDQLSDIYNMNMLSAMNGDVQAALEYMVGNAGILGSVADTAKRNAGRDARDAVVFAENIERVNNIDFRNELYEQFKKFKELYERYGHGYTPPITEDNDASVVFASLLEETKTISTSQYDNMVVDVIGSAQTLFYQMKALMESVEGKKNNSLIYRYADLVAKEFDFEYTERELATFVDRHQITYMR